MEKTFSCSCTSKITRYKSFDTHADAWYIPGVQPIITLPENATYHEEATSKKIDKLVNKMWKKGGDVQSKMQDKSRFSRYY